jgi:hypothetical protein
MQNVDAIVAQAIEYPERVADNGNRADMRPLREHGAASGIKRIRSIARTSRSSTDRANAGLALIE